MAESTKGNKSFVGGIPRISTLEEQIERVVAKYQGIRQPCAIIHDLLSNKGDHSLLIDVVTQQLMLIKSRSQAWEDGHVTVWDKALVILSKNGTDVGNLSVLELYVEEFIGVNPNSRGRYAGDTVAQHISVKSLQGEPTLYHLREIEAAPHKIPPRPYPCKVECQEPLQKLEASECSSSHLKITPDSPDDRKLARILDIYTKAKNDFMELGKADTTAKFHAARFLRDTAENALIYLRARHMGNHPIIPELEKMFDQAKEEAIRLSGGKKRRFEIDEDPIKKPRRYPDKYRKHYGNSQWSRR